MHGVPAENCSVLEFTTGWRRIGSRDALLPAVLPHLHPACASPVPVLRRMAVDLMGLGRGHASALTSPRQWQHRAVTTAEAAAGAGGAAGAHAAGENGNKVVYLEERKVLASSVCTTTSAAAGAGGAAGAHAAGEVGYKVFWGGGKEGGASKAGTIAAAGADTPEHELSMSMSIL
eukprot:1114631-Pelagomonas_calceolata.AAC.2